MSTLPDDAWRDAGLEEPEDTTSLVEEEEVPGVDPDAGQPPEEYRPGTARPDLEGAAAEADVVEQSRVVPEPDEQDGAAPDDDADR